MGQPSRQSLTELAGHQVTIMLHLEVQAHRNCKGYSYNHLHKCAHAPRPVISGNNKWQQCMDNRFTRKRFRIIFRERELAVVQ